MMFVHARAYVSNRGVPPEAFLRALVAWGDRAADEIFARNENPADIYASVKGVLGPWETEPDSGSARLAHLHRRAAMLEVMRVLAGFESSWNWGEGVDVTNPSSTTPETREAGAWQVSANSMLFGPELKLLVLNQVGTTEGNAFQRAMKEDHELAMEYIARLLRRTVRHNGPVLRGEIHPWLQRKAVEEFRLALVEERGNGTKEAGAEATAGGNA